MKTQLLEISNSENQKLRGILSTPDNKTKKGAICLHGFERCSSTEKKFKLLSDSLVEKMVTVLRIDFTGCGLSDGDFKYTTIENQAKDFILAFKKLQEELGGGKVSVIAHSLGACVLATKIEEIKDSIEKIILIAPALNQKDLMKYWFVSSQMKKTNPEIEITWENYKQHLDESAFKKDCERTDKITKTSFVDAKYFLESKNYDFSSSFDFLKNKVLHIHGSKDTSVPIKSLHTTFDNTIIIENGDHDVEKPNFLEQWKNKVVDFIIN